MNKFKYESPNISCFLNKDKISLNITIDKYIELKCLLNELLTNVKELDGFKFICNEQYALISSYDEYTEDIIYSMVYKGDNNKTITGFEVIRLDKHKRLTPGKYNLFIPAILEISKALDLVVSKEIEYGQVYYKKYSKEQFYNMEYKLNKLDTNQRINILEAKLKFRIDMCLENNNKSGFLIYTKILNELKKYKISYYEELKNNLTNYYN